MSFHFDPYTGEKIEDGEGTTPETTTPAENAQTAGEEQSDSAAVVEAYQDVMSESTPMESIEREESTDGAAADAADAAGAATEEQKVTGYDPMTGQPIYADNTAGSAGPQAASDASKASKGVAGFFTSKVFIIVAAVVAALLIVLFVGSRILMGRNHKFYKAIKNTAKLNHLEEVLFDATNTLAGGESTISASGEVYDYSAEITLAQSLKAKKINLDVTVEGDDTATLALFIDDQKVVLQAPDIIGDDVAYDYLSGDHGDLDKVAKEQLDAADTALQSVFSMDDTTKYRNRMLKVTRKYFNKLKFRKDDKKNIKIDGKKRSCKGYTAEIDSDFVMDYYDEFYEIVKDYLDESELSKSEKTQMKSAMNEASKALDDMPDIDLTLYLYKGALAGITVEEGRDELFSAEFHGGATRMENMDVAVAGQEAFEIEGETRKGVETMSVIVMGEEVMNYEYDFKDGDLTIEAGEGKDSASLEGELTPKSGGFSLDIQDASFGGSSIKDVAGKDFSLKFSITDKASVRNIKDDEADYINDLSMSDLTGIAEDAGKWANKFFGMGDMLDLW